MNKNTKILTLGEPGDLVLTLHSSRIYKGFLPYSWYPQIGAFSYFEGKWLLQLSRGAAASGVASLDGAPLRATRRQMSNR